MQSPLVPRLHLLLCDGNYILQHRRRGETAMTSICWKSAVTWSLLGLMFLLFVLMWGPAPALAKSADAVLYEVTEDMYLSLRDAENKVVSYVSDVTKATHRQAVAQLAGTAKFGTPLCPAWVKSITKAKACTINAKGSDNL